MIRKPTSLPVACALLAALVIFPSTTPALSDLAPHTLWVAPLRDGVTLESAWKAGAVVLDRTPDALIVSDRASAAALESLGATVDGPFPIDGAGIVSLHYLKEKRGVFSMPDDAALAAAGIEMIWSGGRTVILASRGSGVPDETTVAAEGRELRTLPIRVPRAAVAVDRFKAQATVFEPVIQQMVDLVDSASYMQWIGNLAGSNNPVTIGGGPVNLTTRYTSNAQCDTVERYVYERFQAMGFTDVQFDPYSFSTTNARNIVATLPGTVTPNLIYVIGGHVDSREATSPHDPAPGANDNASGTAAVLEAARILKDYQFESTIKFIAFTGEEQGLYGSADYAARAAANGDQIQGAVITDMVAWWNNQYQIDIEGETAYSALMQVMDDACAQYTALATNQVFGSWGSDHVSFQNNGFPAFLAIESEYGSYPCYHQLCDTTENNDGNFGVEVTRAIIATVGHLAVPLGLGISHTPLASTEDQIGPYEVIAQIVSVDPLIADSLRLHYSTGGPYVESLMTATGQPDEFHAFIPGQPANTTIDYYITAADNAGRHADSPSGAPASTHSFSIGSLQTVLFEDFESGGAGWTHGGTQDDWQLGAPQGLTEDPSAAYSGTNVYGNDLTGLGSASGRYENNADNWLLSPTVDCTDYTGVTLALRRWLAVERSNGGQWDHASIEVNGTEVWQSPSGADLNDGAWIDQQIDISALADNNPAVAVRFVLHSDVSVTFGGWNIDDVKITGIGPGTPTGVAGVAPPARVILHANRPNPFNPLTVIRYEIPFSDHVELAVFDVRGRLVRKLIDGAADAGAHEVVWDGDAATGDAAASGVYFYRLRTGDFSETRKMLLVR